MARRGTGCTLSPVIVREGGRSSNRRSSGVALGTGNARVKIVPVWILLFNQSDLPLPIPFLESFFALNGNFDVVILFIVDQLDHVVLLRKATHELGFMLEDATDEIIGHAHIQCTADSTDKNVDVVLTTVTRHRWPVFTGSPPSRGRQLSQCFAKSPSKLAATESLEIVSPELAMPCPAARMRSTSPARGETHASTASGPVTPLPTISAVSLRSDSSIESRGRAGGGEPFKMVGPGGPARRIGDAGGLKDAALGVVGRRPILHRFAGAIR